LKGNANGLEPLADLKLNFAAPGDRKLNGQWYLAFPRDFRPSYQRLPVVAGDAGVQYFRCNADHTDIAGTELDWFYGSQARDVRRLRIELVFGLPAVATRVAAPLVIDGRPDAPLNDHPYPIQFCDSGRRIYQPACALLNYDDENLYLTLRREAARNDNGYVGWTAETEGEDALTWKDNSWSIRLGGKGLVSFDVSVSGAWRVDVYKSDGEFDDDADGKSQGKGAGGGSQWHWKSAVYVSPDGKTWTTEVAIPWADLQQNAGIERTSGSAVYIQGINRTGVGPDAFEYKYRAQEKHNIHCGTAPLAFDSLPPLEERHYRMLLHFVELDDVAPGERVCDIRVQGKTLIENLDIAKEAGGAFKPLIREISEISASDLLDIEFIPHDGSLPPVISGLELIAK